MVLSDDIINTSFEMMALSVLYSNEGYSNAMYTMSHGGTDVVKLSLNFKLRGIEIKNLLFFEVSKVNDQEFILELKRQYKKFNDVDLIREDTMYQKLAYLGINRIMKVMLIALGLMTPEEVENLPLPQSIMEDLRKNFMEVLNGKSRIILQQCN